MLPGSLSNLLGPMTRRRFPLQNVMQAPQPQPDLMPPINVMTPDMEQMAQAPQEQQQKPNKAFGDNGWAWKAMGVIGDALRAADGQSGMFLPAVQDAQKEQYKALQAQVLEQQKQAAQWSNPAPNDFDKLLLGQGLKPNTPEWQAAHQAKVTAETDPITTFALPNGQFYSGPKSGVASVLGGGGKPAEHPAPPPQAIADLRRSPETAAHFDEIFGPGASQRFLGGQTVAPSGGFR